MANSHSPFHYCSLQIGQSNTCIPANFSNTAMSSQVDSYTEIRILSGFLGHKHINWRPAPDTLHAKLAGSTVMQGDDLAVKLYFHLANLLNIKKDIVTAVTGTLGRENVTPVIVYSTNSRASTTSKKHSGSGKPFQAECPSSDDLKNRILHLPKYVFICTL